MRVIRMHSLRFAPLTWFFLCLMPALGIGSSGILRAQTQGQKPAPGGASATSNTVKPEEVDASHPKLRTRNPRYRIQADDILELSFRFTPEFDQEVTVQPDGFVQLKGLPNDVRIQGLTVPETIQSLKKAYASVLNDP